MLVDVPEQLKELCFPPGRSAELQADGQACFGEPTRDGNRREPGS